MNKDNGDLVSARPFHAPSQSLDSLHKTQDDQAKLQRADHYWLVRLAASRVHDASQLVLR